MHTGDKELLSASVERVQVDNQLFMTPYPALLYPLQVSANTIYMTRDDVTCFYGIAQGAL
jgi:hypothetical protein